MTKKRENTLKYQNMGNLKLINSHHGTSILLFIASTLVQNFQELETICINSLHVCFFCSASLTVAFWLGSSSFYFIFFFLLELAAAYFSDTFQELTYCLTALEHVFMYCWDVRFVFVPTWNKTLQSYSRPVVSENCYRTRRVSKYLVLSYYWHSNLWAVEFNVK